MKRLIITLVIALALAPCALADTIYLRDGRVLRGTVLGFLNGRVVVRLTNANQANASANDTSLPPSQTAAGVAAGEVRFFRPAEIDRIEIDGRSLDEARFVVRNVQVQLGPNWIDSGVDVRHGQRVQVKANGTIYANRLRITPAGLRTTDPNAPLPRAAAGVLIGAVGNDQDTPIVELGSSREFTADRDGRLYLTVNRAEYTDARGAYNVEVRTERQLPQRRTDAARNTRDDQDDTYDPSENEERDTTPAPVRSRFPTARPGNDPYNRNRAPREVTISVPGTSRGTDTGLDLRAGDRVTLSAAGRVIAGRRAGEVGPEGGASSGVGSILGTRPVPNAGVGALIGYLRMSNGQASQPFYVGSQLTLTAQADGRLILLVNDDNYADNGGEFTVRIVIEN
ncbi:MAG: LecA/PA-IL family lectin [Acidobacteria bacterium]|nr:LecA/PA-IL family lectin [Acidobacteriota bacterium]MCA1641285.1 LecA/PA-IL family lectin [Acidobacteriota bacterium]